MDKVEAMHIKDTITTTDLFLMIIKAIDLCMWKKIPSITTVYWCISYWNKTEKINAVTTKRVVWIVSNSTHNLENNCLLEGWFLCMKIWDNVIKNVICIIISGPSIHNASITNIFLVKKIVSLKSNS